MYENELLRVKMSYYQLTGKKSCKNQKKDIQKKKLLSINEKTKNQ